MAAIRLRKLSINMRLSCLSTPGGSLKAITIISAAISSSCCNSARPLPFSRMIRLILRALPLIDPEQSNSEHKRPITMEVTDLSWHDTPLIWAGASGTLCHRSMPMVVMEVALRNAWPATGQICSHSEKNTHRSEMVKSQKILTAVSALCKRLFFATYMAAKRSRRTFTRTI